MNGNGYHPEDEEHALDMRRRQRAVVNRTVRRIGNKTVWLLNDGTVVMLIAPGEKVELTPEEVMVFSGYLMAHGHFIAQQGGLI